MESYEKKYKEAQKWIESIYPNLSHEQQMEAEAFFPELKESEDEKIRVELIKHLKEGAEGYVPAGGTSDYQRWLAWLEKQGEQKNKINSCKFTCEDILALECSMKIAKITKGGDELYKILVPLYNKIHNAYLDELQGEQKPVDKVEPKFNVGDWVIDKQGIVHQIANVIENVTNHIYGYDIVGGGYFNDNTEGVRLWTIQDAKDGDVLAFKNDISGIIICKSPTDYDTRSYCRLVSDNLINKEESGWDSTLLVPAAKEQRDVLMKAMTDAGYTFDFEKKELKKIDNETEIPFSAKDSELQEATYYIPKGFYAEIDDDKVVIKKDEQPAAWSEEDNMMIEETLYFLREYQQSNRCKDENGMQNSVSCEKWLRSLKERIGG